MKKASSMVLALVLALGLLPGLFGCGGAPAEEAAPGAPAEETTPAEEVAPGVAAGEVDLALSWKEAYAQGKSEVEWFKEECARLRAQMKDLEPITIKVWDEGLVGSDWDAEWLAVKRILDTESGGKIKVEWYPGGILFNAVEACAALTKGTINCCVRFVYGMGANYMANALGDQWVKSDEGSMAYSFSDRGADFKTWVFSHPACKAYPLMTSGGTSGVGDACSNKKVTKLEDLKGIKIHTLSPSQTKYQEALGMVSSPIPIGELWIAFYQGSLDAEWGVGRCGIYDMKWYQVTKYFWNAPIYRAPRATPELDGLPWYTFPITVNRDWYLGLPRPYQDMFRLVVNEEFERHMLYYQARQQYVAWMLVNDYGMVDLNIRNEAPEIIEARSEAAKKVYRESLLKYCGDYGIKILDEQIAFIEGWCEDPKNNDKFIPWHKRVLAKAKEMYAEGQARMKAGEDREKVWDTIEGRKLIYDSKYEDYDELLKEFVGVESFAPGEKTQLKRFGMPGFVDPALDEPEFTVPFEPYK